MEVLYVLAYLYVFWLLYVLVMGLYRAYLADRLSRGARVLGAPVVALGFVIDVMTQMTLATVIFVELPREWLVTQRLKRYMADGSGWRHQTAVVVCTKLLDPFDPTGKHC